MKALFLLITSKHACYMFEKAIGKIEWTIAGGHISIPSHGHEPEFTSYNKISILNAGEKDADIELTLYYTEDKYVGPYPICVAARRVRHVRFNDFIDPLPVPLGVDFACRLTSSEPVVVQFTLQDTSQRENARFTTLAYAQR